jgi:hypothetical protein
MSEEMFIEHVLLPSSFDSSFNSTFSLSLFSFICNIYAHLEEKEKKNLYPQGVHGTSSISIININPSCVCAELHLTGARESNFCVERDALKHKKFIAQSMHFPNSSSFPR